MNTVTHRICFSLLPALVFFHAHAQAPFNRLFGTYQTEIGKDGYVLQDSTVYALGTSSAFVSMSSQVYLLKLDKNGNIVWSKFYGGTGVDDATSMYFDADSSIYISATSYAGSAKGYDIKIIKTDKNGNLIWEKTYGTPAWDVPSKLIRTGLGTYMVCGHTYGGTAGMIDAMIFQFTDAGDSLSFEILGDVNDDKLVDLTLRSADTVALCGMTIGPSGKKRAWLVEYQLSTGTLQQFKYGQLWETEFNAIAMATTGNYLIGGTYDSLNAGANLSFFGSIYDRNTHQRLFEFRGDGPYDETCTDIRAMNGLNHVMGNTTSYGLGQTDAVIYQFDDYANFVNGFTYGTPDDDFSSSITPNAMGYYTFFGTSQDLYGVSDVWVVNVDATYLVASSVNSQLDVNSVHEFEENKPLVSVYPNPFSDVVNISADETPFAVSVMDNCGRLVMSAQKTNAVDLSALAPGTYFMTIFTVENVPVTRTIVKMR